MKILKIFLAFVFAVLGVYSAMIEVSSNDPIIFVLMVFVAAFITIYILCKTLYNFYKDSTTEV